MATGESIEARIRRQMLLVLAMAALIGLPALHLGLGELSESYMLTRLQHDADILIRALEQSDEGELRMHAGAVPAIYQRPGSGHYFVVRGSSGQLVSQSLGREPLPELSRGRDDRASETHLLNDKRWLIWHRRLRIDDSAYQLWVAEDVSPFLRHQLRFELAALALVVLLGVVLALTQRRVLRRAFAQLEPLYTALAARERGEAAALPTTLPQEVAGLADAVREILAHQDQQLRRSRTAVGNLAHELKRPLQQLLDAAGDNNIHNTDHDTEQLQRIYQTLNECVQRELRRARIAGSPSPGQHFLPGRDVPDLVEVMRQISTRDIHFEATLMEGALPLDCDDMLELLGNLLDNAWRHAQQRVRLDISRSATQYTICVQDDGAGVPEGDLPRLTRRGERLDETRRQDGHGLGLSVCQAIVDSYAGSLLFSRSALGGLQVQACFPIP